MKYNYLKMKNRISLLFIISFILALIYNAFGTYDILNNGIIDDYISKVNEIFGILFLSSKIVSIVLILILGAFINNTILIIIGQILNLIWITALFSVFGLTLKFIYKSIFSNKPNTDI